MRVSFQEVAFAIWSHWLQWLTYLPSLPNTFSSFYLLLRTYPMWNYIFNLLVYFSSILLFLPNSKLQESGDLVCHVHQHIPRARRYLTYVCDSINICWIKYIQIPKPFIWLYDFWHRWPALYFWKISIPLFSVTVFFFYFPEYSLFSSYSPHPSNCVCFPRLNLSSPLSLHALPKA